MGTPAKAALQTLSLDFGSCSHAKSESGTATSADTLPLGRRDQRLLNSLGRSSARDMAAHGLRSRIVVFGFRQHIYLGDEFVERMQREITIPEDTPIPSV